MLQDCPVEVIEQIAENLPTASSIINLSLTNRGFHSIVSAGDYNVFQAFVQRYFPTINAPPYWKDVARVLTSRSRAWDRRAFIATECRPPAGANNGAAGGYAPVIGTYEEWLGGSWADRKEVLLWGAGGSLCLRTTENGVVTWSYFIPPNDLPGIMDIMDLKLLRPHQHENSGGETIILQRITEEVTRIETSTNPNGFRRKSCYANTPTGCLRIDVSEGPEPILAAAGTGCINLYPVHSEERSVPPISSIAVQDRPGVYSRMQYIKFLSDSMIAISHQVFEGRDCAPIIICNLTPTGLSTTPIAESMSFIDSKRRREGRHFAHIITGLDDVGTSGSGPQPLFLSGWSDGITRLYDIRIPHRSVSNYIDPVDDGQIISLLPIGHERFLAGGLDNGCLKTFDLRMPGARPYSYLDARPTHSANSTTHPEPQRDVNILLSPMVDITPRRWEPLPRRPSKRTERYRGAVYSLSSPSPSSPTVYAGIFNHVLQLDFISTDDFRKGHTTPGLISQKVRIVHDGDKELVRGRVLDLSCYERPRAGRESTDPVLLRKQTPLRAELAHDNMDSYGQREEMWDERWRLDTSGQRQGFMDPAPRTIWRAPPRIG